MTSIPNFTDTELWIIRTTLKERYGQEPELQFADAELRLDPIKPVLTECPTVVWQGHDATFAIFKTGEGRYRAQFFYNVREQYGTGVDEFGDISECVTTLLQTQADQYGNRQS
jgi:hypothetical protein